MTAPVAIRLWRRVEKTSTCWIWTGYVGKGGYGVIWSGDRNKLAHRVAYEVAKGPIPDGEHIDHLCRNRACVNPEHLEAVTPEENKKRASYSSGRYSSCLHGHPISELTIVKTKSGFRCPVCYHNTNRRVRPAKQKRETH